jgi:hypothetical protein
LHDDIYRVNILDMIFTDIIQTDEYNNIWAECIDYIRHHCTNDPLYKNYISLSKQDFISLTVAIDNDKIVAFSGAQCKPEWGPNIVRISSRFWIDPSSRHGVTKFKESNVPWYNSEFLLPIQIAAVKDFPHMFISREGSYRNSFGKYINLVNSFNNTNFILLDGYYDILNTEQMIAVDASTIEEAEQILREDTLLSKLSR